MRQWRRAAAVVFHVAMQQDQGVLQRLQRQICLTSGVIHFMTPTLKAL
jgi:hypothetical protein